MALHRRAYSVYRDCMMQEVREHFMLSGHRLDVCYLRLKTVGLYEEEKVKLFYEFQTINTLRKLFQNETHAVMDKYSYEIEKFRLYDEFFARNMKD